VPVVVNLSRAWSFGVRSGILVCIEVGLVVWSLRVVGDRILAMMTSQAYVGRSRVGELVAT
jgi:hypothetical protein